MPYLSSLERMAIEDGLKRGREEGREEGLQAARAGIALALEAKFGQPGRKLIAQVRQITDVAELQRLAKIIKAAKTAADVRQHLT